VYPSIKDFNIIPSSTIFINGQWEEYNINELKTKISENSSVLDFKQMIIICVTKKSIDLFLDFIKA
jgi:hypothetical protein